MTATLTAPTPALAGPRRTDLPAVAATRFTHLLRAELRKLVDTRAGRWLLISAVLVSAAATAVAVWAFPTESVDEVFLFAFMPLGILLPVCAILSTTAEWSQRTGLTTFALEPRRWRVAAAKLIAAQLAAVAVMVTATAIAYAGAGIASLGERSWAGWALDPGTVGGAALNLCLLMLQASAIGFIVLNTPAAVVLFFVVPQLWSNAVGLIPWLTERAIWLDLNQALSPLVSTSEAMTGQGWLYVASAACLWVLLPLAAGIVSFVRAEVK